MLGSCTTSIFRNCGCGCAFGLLQGVPCGIDPGVCIEVPPKHEAPLRGGFGGVFSSSGIVATKPKVVLYEI